jgi:glycine/D-amino acid oxidase-like deaminating enzyme
VTSNVRATILPGGNSVTDTRRLYSGVRVLSDGRVHVSADGPAFMRGGEVFRNKADRRVRQLFPQITEIEWEEWWGGWVDMTTDQYPHLHELAPGLWGAIGLCGRGIVWGTLIGREVAWRMMERERDEWFMPVVPLRRAGIRPFAAPLIGALMKYYRALDRIEMAGYVRPRKQAAD